MCVASSTDDIKSGASNNCTPFKRCPLSHLLVFWLKWCPLGCLVVFITSMGFSLHFSQKKCKVITIVWSGKQTLIFPPTLPLSVLQEKGVEISVPVIPNQTPNIILPHHHHHQHPPPPPPTLTTQTNVSVTSHGRFRYDHRMFFAWCFCWACLSVHVLIKL